MVKLEKELGQVSKDYDDIARELKLADDRANKAGADAAHFESLLREEQTKIVKIDNAKKSLENEVRSLSVRIEEIETNSVATSKRTIQKMEVRIQELEVMINTEKKAHAVSMSELQIKNRSIKELILQSEEDRKNIIILQESLDKLNEKIKMYKRQLEEQESISNSNIMRVKKFQRELESAEARAEEAESTLNQFRSRERSSSVNLKAQKPELKKLNPPSTNSDPEKECLLLPLLAVKNPPMSRKLRLLSRKLSTKSMSQEVLPTPWLFPPVHPQNSHPPPPFNPQETCALAPFMPPALVELGLWLVQDQHTELPASGQGL